MSPFFCQPTLATRTYHPQGLPLSLLSPTLILLLLHSPLLSSSSFYTLPSSHPPPFALYSPSPPSIFSPASWYPPPSPSSMINHFTTCVYVPSDLFSKDDITCTTPDLFLQAISTHHILITATASSDTTTTTATSDITTAPSNMCICLPCLRHCHTRCWFCGCSTHNRT